jgi:protein-disulfide isomerase
MIAFADLQCPYCGMFARDALPTIVRDYVRPGKVRIVFQGLAFVGPDSDKALRVVLAASLQNHGWDVIESLYRVQGDENGGWATDAVLREATNVPGLKRGRAFLSVRSAPVEEQLRLAKRLAQEVGVHGKPAFLVGRTGGPLRLVPLSSLTADALRPALDAALG